MRSALGRLRPAAATWLAAALLAAMAGGYTWATWRYFTLPTPGGIDFLAHYSVWEAYLKHGLNPYSDEATLHTHMAYFGRAALPHEDQHRLTYPFYSIIIHGPFVLLDYSRALALHMVVLQAALIVGVACTLRLFNWRPPAWLLACLVVWSLLLYPQARAIILGQVAIFGFLSLAVSLYLLRAGRFGLAGAVLVLSTVKPTLVFLAAPFLLLWALAGGGLGGRRFVAGFGLTLTALVLGSLAAVPTWIGDWLLRVRQYPEYTVGQSPVWLLTHLALPRLGQPGEWALTAALLAVMVWAWALALRRGHQPGGGAAFHWALGITLAVSYLIVPRSATTNYMLMIVPTFFILSRLDRGRLAGRALVAAVLLLSLAGYWWLHFATVVGDAEHRAMYLPWPVLLLVVLLAGRSWLLESGQPFEAWPPTAEAVR